MPPSRPLLLQRSAMAIAAALMGLSGLAWGPVTGAEASPPAAAPGPSLTLPTEATFVLGRAGDSYLIEAEGDPTPAIAVDALPPGLRLISHGDGSATLHGTATGPAGAVPVRVRAQSATGTTVEWLTVAIHQAPDFSERKPVVLRQGQFSSVPVRTVGYPAPAIGVEGDLPTGLELVDLGNGTAVIAGTPRGGPISAPVTLTAVNVVADASFFTTIEVVAASPPKAPVTSALGGPRREP